VVNQMDVMKKNEEREMLREVYTREGRRMWGMVQ